MQYMILNYTLPAEYADADAARAAAYQPWWAVRAHALARSGAREAALAAYDRAAALSPDPGVRAFLAARRAALLSG